MNVFKLSIIVGILFFFQTSTFVIGEDSDEEIIRRLGLKEKEYLDLRKKLIIELLPKDERNIKFSQHEDLVFYYFLKETEHIRNIVKYIKSTSPSSGFHPALNMPDITGWDKQKVRMEFYKRFNQLVANGIDHSKIVKNK
uniref:Secreted protein n=1 Tax=Parastrongyloides trichosuri TaxID=131310 RepID=A0A0N4ZPT0_PARTI